MVFVGAVIMPHGTLPFDGNKQSESVECRQRYSKLPSGLARKFTNLYEGMCRTGQAVASMNPDIIILDTPHGIKLDTSVGVYVNDIAKGDATWNDCWSEFKVELQLNLSKSEDLIKHLKNDGIASEGICCFSRKEAPLRWGEVVPAWYIQKHLEKEVRYILMSQPRQPSPTDTVSDVRLRIGYSLHKYIESIPERVVVVISGDLSHVYFSDYPDELYQPAKGWTLSAEHVSACKMERAFLGWVKALRDTRLVDSDEELPGSEQEWSHDNALPWLQKAAELQPTAYSCGLIGFIVLHALLQCLTQKGLKVKADLIVCEAPTYYGMMAATFTRL